MKSILYTVFYFTLMDSLDFHFKHPTTKQVVIPTRCRKTKLVQRIFKEQLIQPFDTRIIRVYNAGN